MYFNWRLINLQHCGAFCQTWTWISHGCACPPPWTPPTALPLPCLWVVPEHWLWVPCLMHWTCPGHLWHLLAVLMPASGSSRPAFHMMYSAYKLNNQGDNIQPWRSPFPIWNQSIVPCLVLTIAAWPDLYTGFSEGRQGGLVFPCLEEFSSLLWSTQSKALA